VIFRPGCRRVAAGRLRKIVRGVLLAVHGRVLPVTLLLTRDAELRRLNRRFRGLDRATDVLSFPAPAGAGEEGSIGDVAVSVDSADRQARDAGWTPAEEVEFLVLHGMLHLLGFDHETDRGEMDRLQRHLARRLLRTTRGLPPPAPRRPSP
jgi:probable rRNA maturation factor